MAERLRRAGALAMTAAIGPIERARGVVPERRDGGAIRDFRKILDGRMSQPICKEPIVMRHSRTELAHVADGKNRWGCSFRDAGGVSFRSD